MFMLQYIGKVKNDQNRYLNISWWDVHSVEFMKYGLFGVASEINWVFDGNTWHTISIFPGVQNASAATKINLSLEPWHAKKYFEHCTFLHQSQFSQNLVISQNPIRKTRETSIAGKVPSHLHMDLLVSVKKAMREGYKKKKEKNDHVNGGWGWVGGGATVNSNN